MIRKSSTIRERVEIRRISVGTLFRMCPFKRGFPILRKVLVILRKETARFSLRGFLTRWLRMRFRLNRDKFLMLKLIF